MFKECHIPQKIVWKRICKDAVVKVEHDDFNKRTQSEEFDLFKSTHLDISDFSYLWYLSRQFPHLLEKCFLVARYLAEPVTNTELLCEFCGRFYKDRVLHAVTNCENYSVIGTSFGVI